MNYVKTFNKNVKFNYGKIFSQSIIILFHTTSAHKLFQNKTKLTTAITLINACMMSILH